MGKLNRIIQPYGGMYEDNISGSPITVVSAGTYYQWTTVSGHDESGTGLLEYDATNKQLVIKKAGKYLLSFRSVFSAKTGTTVQMAIHKTPSGGFPAILPAHQGWAVMPQGEEIHPSAMVANVGVLTGAVTKLAAADRDYVTGSEITGTPGFQHDFTFSTNKAPGSFHFHGRYVHSASDYIKWLIYRYDTAAWVDLIDRGTVITDMPVEPYDHSQNYAIPAVGTYVSGGQVKIRCEHYTGGNNQATALYLDELTITARDIRDIATVSYPVNLAVDDRLDFRVTSNENNAVINSHITNLSLNRIGD